MTKYFILGISLLFMGCKTKDRQLSQTQNPDYFQFRLNPELNKRYSYLITNSTELTQEINGEKLENSNELEMGTDYFFEADSMPGFKLKIGYKKFRLSIKAMEEEKVLDAANASSAVMPADKMFAAFDKAEISAKVDTTGTVTEITGVDKIKEKMAELAGNDEEALQMIDGSLKQYLNDLFFKQLLESNLKAFSSRRMKVGDTINVSTPVGGELNVNASVVYKLASIKNGIAKIVTNADIDINEQQLVIDGTNIVATMKGKQTGTVEIEISSGMLQESETELTLKGTMLIAGTEAPFKLITINTVLLSK